MVYSFPGTRPTRLGDPGSYFRQISFRCKTDYILRYLALSKTTFFLTLKQVLISKEFGCQYDFYLIIKYLTTVCSHVTRKAIIFVFLFLILGSSFTLRFAMADEVNVIGTITVSTDKTSYFTEESIVISGEVTEKKMPIIAIRIFDPDNKILGAYSVEIDENSHFTKTIIADIPFYEKSGTYTITTEYGKLKAETIFKIETESGEISTVTPIIEKPHVVLPQIISFGTNKHTYQNDDTIVLSGTVSAISEPQVTITIFDPNKTPTGIYLVTVNPDLAFSTSFLAKYSINFKTEGKYSIIAQYGNSESKRTEIKFLEKSNTPKYITQKTPVITKSVSEHINTTSSNSSILDPVVNTTNISQTKNIPHIEKSEIIKSGKSDNKNSKSENISENTSDIQDKEIVYFYSSVKCEKNPYEDVIAHYNNPGPALTHLCKYDDAIFFYDQTLQSDPKNIHALTDKGSALASLGKYQDAIVYYDKALEIDSQYVTALNNKGNSLASLGKYQDAIVYYDKALEIDSQYVTALNNKEKASEAMAISSVHETELGVTPISNYEPFVSTEENVEETGKRNDIATQFANVFSVIGASLMSLFGG